MHETSDRIDTSISPSLFVRYMSQQAKILELIFLLSLDFLQDKLKQLEAKEIIFNLHIKFWHPIIMVEIMVAEKFYKTSKNEKFS